MDVVAGLIFVAGLIVLLAGSVGFVAPSLFKDKKTGETPKRLHLLLGGIFGAVVLFAVGAVLAPDKGATGEQVKASEAKASDVKPPEVKALTAAVEEPKEAPAAKKPEVKPVKSLDITPEEFRKAFNDSVAKIDADYKLAEFDIEKGEVNDVFKRSIGKNMGLVGSINKQDGKLLELSILITGGGSNEEILRNMVVFLSAVSALNPSAENNGEVVTKMVKQAMANIKTAEPIEREVGSLKYTAVASEIMGFMFVVSPK